VHARDAETVPAGDHGHARRRRSLVTADTTRIDG
jgi:hypothetical protein